MADPSILRFRRVVATAYAQLEARRQEVNDLNVFPVADGDTGDNMALTMRAVMDELDRLDGQPVDQVGREEIVQAVAHAALMGARGNSGVILSQIVRGAAKVLASRQGQLVDPQLVHAALSASVRAAYDAVPNATEGTMLTVLREMEHAISERLPYMEQVRLPPDASDPEQDALLIELLQAAVDTGEAALERTMQQLDVLAEHQVVDAGAYGLLLIVAGIVAGLRGETTIVEQLAHHEPPRVPASHHEDSRYRWCSNFVVTGEGLDPRRFVSSLERLGDSVMVVGDTATVRVHVHTNDREAAKALFAGAGQITHEDHADMWRQIDARDRRLRPAPGLTGVIAVAHGDGMRALFESLGAYVVDGGSTLNPSPHELLRGIADLDAPEVVILPNSSNVVMAANQAAELCDRPASVVESTSQQAGLAALIELDPDSDAEANAARLTEALAGIRTGGVAPAARDDAQGRFVRGDAVGFVGEDPIAWGGAGSTLVATVASLAEGAELVTVIEGRDAPIPLEDLSLGLPDGVELELHRGDQPNWWWLIAAQ